MAAHEVPWGDSSQRIAALNNSARRNPNWHISTSGCAPQLAGYSPGNLDPQVNHLDSFEWRQQAKSRSCLRTLPAGLARIGLCALGVREGSRWQGTVESLPRNHYGSELCPRITQKPVEVGEWHMQSDSIVIPKPAVVTHMGTGKWNR